MGLALMKLCYFSFIIAFIINLYNFYNCILGDSTYYLNDLEHNQATRHVIPFDFSNHTRLISVIAFCAAVYFCSADSCSKSTIHCRCVFMSAAAKLK